MAYFDSFSVQWDHGLSLDVKRSAGTSFGNLETYDCLSRDSTFVLYCYGERETEKCVNCKLQSVLKIKKKTCVKQKISKKKKKKI